MERAFSFLTVVFIASVAQAFIYGGITFINGQFLPSLLKPVYQALPSGMWRVLASQLTFFIFGNVLIAYIYRVYGAGYAGVIYIVISVIGMVVTAMLIDHKPLNLTIALGTLLAALGGALVVYGLRGA